MVFWCLTEVRAEMLLCAGEIGYLRQKKTKKTKACVRAGGLIILDVTQIQREPVHSSPECFIILCT